MPTHVERVGSNDNDWREGENASRLTAPPPSTQPLPMGCIHDMWTQPAAKIQTLTHYPIPIPDMPRQR